MTNGGDISGSISVDLAMSGDMPELPGFGDVGAAAAASAVSVTPPGAGAEAVVPVRIVDSIPLAVFVAGGGDIPPDGGGGVGLAEAAGVAGDAGGGMEQGAEKKQGAFQKSSLAGMAKMVAGVGAIVAIGIGALKNSKVMASTMGAVSQLMGALVDTILGPLTPYIVTGMQMLGDFVRWVGRFMKDPVAAMKEAWEWLKENFPKWLMAYLSTWKTIVQIAWNGIKLLAQAVWDDLPGWILAGADLAWEGIKLAGVAIWEGIKTAGVAIWDEIVYWLREKFPIIFGKNPEEAEDKHQGRTWMQETMRAAGLLGQSLVDPLGAVRTIQNWDQHSPDSGTVPNSNTAQYSQQPNPVIQFLDPAALLRSERVVTNNNTVHIQQNLTTDTSVSPEEALRIMRRDTREGIDAAVNNTR